jgi:hypothetical protein
MEFIEMTPLSFSKIKHSKMSRLVSQLLSEYWCWEADLKRGRGRND